MGKLTLQLSMMIALPALVIAVMWMAKEFGAVRPMDVSGLQYLKGKTETEARRLLGSPRSVTKNQGALIPKGEKMGKMPSEFAMALQDIYRKRVAKTLNYRGFFVHVNDEGRVVAIIEDKLLGKRVR